MLEVIDGEIYLGLHHGDRNEDMCLWFDMDGGYVRGHVHFPDGTESDLPTMESAEAALLGVGW